MAPGQNLFKFSFRELASKLTRRVKHFSSPLTHTLLTWVRFSKSYDRPGFPSDNKLIMIKGETKPWFTYPAIELLDSFDIEFFSVFEWGSGNSTSYFNNRNCKTLSIESDLRWAKSQLINSASSIKFVMNLEEYVSALIDSKCDWDIVLIDGEQRAACAIAFVEYLKTFKTKLLIFDNSNWFPNAAAHLIQATGWIPLSLNGFGPVNNYPFQTLFLINPSWIPSVVADQKPLGSSVWKNPEDLQSDKS